MNDGGRAAAVNRKSELVISRPLAARQRHQLLRRKSLRQHILFVYEKVDQVREHDAADPLSERVHRSQIRSVRRKRYRPIRFARISAQSIKYFLSRIEARPFL